MKKKILNRVLVIVWPIIQFFILNYGQEITEFTVEAVKQKIQYRTTEKMKEALEKAKEAEKQAESIKDAKLKMEFFELAKRYQEEAEYQKRFLHDISESIGEASEEIVSIIQENTAKIDVKDVMVIDKKKKTLKAVESKRLIKPLPNNKSE